ncbi:putative GTP cyclohydrolase I feedback regulatory protein [Ancylostoma duodenale]|uniref:Putative GTP cyclohydrolase I feedback regulatory protein n=1 Tax=Ancylostoma duodenale TaxID=51022 RepID=A0A0C2GWZ0_9BILA|nr:putative GTP cyclohydrolase I feedback regulatory protein [Ancylostoma duodenale]
MPYMLISTQIRLEAGPTFVGDGDSDKGLMERLQAKPSQQLGNEFVASYSVQTSTLVKIAAGTFLVGSTGLYLAQKSVQRRVRSLPHYSESLQIVAEHDQARLRIPVTGTLSCGYMDVMAVRDDEKSPFVTAKIRLVMDESAVSIYDTGKWKEGVVDSTPQK